MGIDIPMPRLGWILESEERAQSQTAYRILASSRKERLKEGSADWWDSGKIASSESIHVTYTGRPLTSGTRVYWTVRVWDKNGKPSDYAEPAWWEMGLLGANDWQGEWIRREEPAITRDEDYYRERPAPLLRKEFRIDKPVKRARVYLSGLGYYELRLNGEKVGDRVLDPAWTTYSKRVLYSVYDVTDSLRQGKNTVGMMLGSGWYDPLPLRLFGRIDLRKALTVGQSRVIMQLNVEYKDGTTASIVTDPSWKTCGGPIVKNNVYLGEVYDARREKPEWDRPDYDESGWDNAVIAKEPLGDLRVQTAPPIRITRTVKPMKITEPKPGVFIVDMGQNFAGAVTMRVKGGKGTRVDLCYGELLYPDGTLNGMTAVCCQIKAKGRGGPGAPDIAFQNDTYILKGEGEETFTPRFTFHGFRYVEITGFPGRPTLETLIGLRMNSDVRKAGHFACSNPMFNQIQEMTEWTLLSNLFGVQSDCPHREKFGYGGDIVASSEMAMLNFDMATFYEKTIYDYLDAVRPNGGFTETAPFVDIADRGLGDESGPIGWGTAFPLLLWQLNQYYGNHRLIEQQYGSVIQWMDLLQKSAKDFIIDVGIGDHESLAPKQIELTSTAFYFYNAELSSRLARILGRTEDANRYARLAKSIRSAFNRKFLDPETGRYGDGSQVSQSFALYMGLVPAHLKDKAHETLWRDIAENHQAHLTTGIFGTKYMLEVLSRAGGLNSAYDIVNQKTFPGWGHMLENGATTLWEHWEFSDNTYSHNHPMFGTVSEWFHKYMSGISPADDAVGFDKVLIRPPIVNDHEWVKGYYDSIRGRIVSEWNWDKKNLRFKLDLRIPVSIRAKVVLPVRDITMITESGKPVEQAKGIRFIKQELLGAVFDVQSGKYSFTIESKK